MLDALTHADFEPRVGETFTVLAPDGGRRALELVRVEVLGSAAGGRDAFSLEFLEGVGAAGEPHLAQQTLRVEHDEMGAFELFLVPRGPADGRMRYDADFT